MGLERAEPPPEAPKDPSFEQFAIQMATAANLTMQKKCPTLMVIPYTLGEARKQNTFVFPMGKSPSGHQVIGFFSPALKIVAGQELNAKSAHQMLRRNGTLFHGAWAVVTVDGADYLGVQETLIAETMQPDEFKTVAVFVAAVAGAFEKELGADVF